MNTEMIQNTRKASIITSALRVLALVILLAFVWNQSVRILKISDAQIVVVADELEVDEEQEFEDVLEVFAPAIHPAGSYNFNATNVNCIDHNQCFVQHYLDELPSPPPEQA